MLLKKFILKNLLLHLRFLLLINSIAPAIQRLPEENRVIQGRDFTITCEASGSPYPAIKWIKVHETLGDNVHQTGNVLRIMNSRPDNRGVYVCIAENEAGSDQSNTFIDIERKFLFAEHSIVNCFTVFLKQNLKWLT